MGGGSKVTGWPVHPPIFAEGTRAEEFRLGFACEQVDVYVLRKQIQFVVGLASIAVAA